MGADCAAPSLAHCVAALPHSPTAPPRTAGLWLPSRGEGVLCPRLHP